MTKTKNLKLTLWEGTDYPSYGVPNVNCNKIDTAFGTISSQVTEHTSDIETINGNVDTINSKLAEHDNKFTDLYQADATLVRKITKNETDIESNTTDISVLKNRVSKVENDSNLLRYYQIGDSGSLTYQTKKQKKYKATATLTKNAGTDNNNFAINYVEVSDRNYINNIHGDIYVNIPKSEITNIDSVRINIISSLFSSNLVIDAPYGLFFADSTSDDSNYKLHFIFDSTYLSNFNLSVGTDIMNVEFYFEILQ
jgi:hypothetical protein